MWDNTFVMENKQIKAAKLSIISNITLVSLKIFAGILTSSMCIISEAIHSLSDFIASVLTYFSVYKSSKPADYDHPFGHGKYEDMTGFIEGVLILFASLFIIFESTKKIILNNPSQGENNIGIIVMFLSALFNFFVSSYLINTSKKTNSISLYTDGIHLRVDIYSSFGVLIGLVLIKITGYYVLDSIIAIFIAFIIFNTAFKILKQTLMRLLDYSLAKEDIEKIKEIVSRFKDYAILKENGIKARNIGPTIDIDLILQFSKDTSICECHKICDEIEKQIRSIYANSSISIHSEPVCYRANCKSCIK